MEISNNAKSHTKTQGSTGFSILEIIRVTLQSGLSE